MRIIKQAWIDRYSSLVIKYPCRFLLSALIMTIVSIFLAQKLEMRMNWTDLLPQNNPVVNSYEEIQDRFGNYAGIVVALEGDYDQITECAQALEPELKQLKSLRNVMGELPLEYFRDHGFVLLKPNEFKRALSTYQRSDLIGVFNGFNNDYETEYTDNEGNLKRDEVKIAQGLLGVKRSLDVLTQNIRTASEAASTNPPQPPNINVAVDALMLGESWVLALDRQMLLIICEPKANQTDIEGMTAAAADVEALVARYRTQFPEIRADLTGMAKIGQDEMNSIGVYTQILSLIALLLIYLLLVKAFRGWMVPMITLLPLIIGIIWTTGLLYLLFGGLNLFTAMMMIVLLGLGIDFSIHFVSRFSEEVQKGHDLPVVITNMVAGTGSGVVTGALTTSAAFLMLMTGETRGVHEFGAAAGFGILLTLISIFLILPPLLIIHYRRSQLKAKAAVTEINEGGSQLIARIALAGWKHPGVFLTVIVLIVVGSIWAMQNIDYEFDFLELEPKGLKSVQLQREIPVRFGMSDHSAWVVTQTVEESRQLKERFNKLPMVGDVNSISDYLPPEDRRQSYTPYLQNFQNNLRTRTLTSWQTGDEQLLKIEIERLWDNLDLVSNLAFIAGLDRIVRVIDELTGTDSETGNVDPSAVLPTLSKLLATDLKAESMNQLAASWFELVQDNLMRMSSPEAISLDDLPENIRSNHQARVGDGFLLHIIPRKYIWDKELLTQFISQTNQISPTVTGMEHLVVLMMEKTLEDGRRSSLLALLVITIMVLIHFRGPLGLLSLLPLAVGSLSMLGLMYLLGMKYNYMNLITVPIILGIGIDDGIHALHRFKEEAGDLKTRISNTFRMVGYAILLTSLTTMIGFGNIAFYDMEGLASFGKVLFMGVGMCFLATIFVLPATLRLVIREKKSEPKAHMKENTGEI